MSNTTGVANTASGVNALFSNISGAANTASGINALLSNTAGGNNTANGVNALFSNTGGDFNTASGVNALFSNTTGSLNTANGVNALFSNTFGSSNTASGVNALLRNTGGDFNTAVGKDALLSNTAGEANTASGNGALFNNITGSNNTAIGNGALARITTTGINNIAIGSGAGSSLTSGNANIYLGNSGQTTESGIIRLGTPGLHTTAVIAGDLFANSFNLLSDTRLKTHVIPLTHVLEQVTQLRGVSFEWNEAAAALTGHTPGQRDLGVIAQEVEALFPELVITRPDGYKTVAYDKLTAVLITAIKELDAATAAQEARLAALEQVSRGGNTPAQLSVFGLAADWPLWAALFSLLAYAWHRKKQA